MHFINTEFLADTKTELLTIEDYQSATPRWCPGCGDNSILTAVQKLCRDQQLPPEKTVFVSGIGCSSRFPHYMKTYGFHGLHGRALPIAQGVKIRRPDLDVFVNMGDGDCCSIGTAHWIHAIRYNMNLTVIVHDNEVYGLTKKQASPTSPLGLKTNTTPYGSVLSPLKMLSTTLGVRNVSFVANAVEWMPQSLNAIIKQAHEHKGFSFIRVLQRCPAYLPHLFDPFTTQPDSILFLKHEDGIELTPELARIYKNQETHDPRNLNRAREIAEQDEKIPVGILYKNPDVPTYDEIRKPRKFYSFEERKAALEREFDKFSTKPENSEVLESETRNGNEI